MVTRRQGRPSRFKPKRYARWRKKYRPKRKVNNQKYNRVSNKLTSKTVKGSRNPRSLKKRVSALEVGSKGHWDIKIFRPHNIMSWGTTANISGQFGDGFLNIPPLRDDDTIDPALAPAYSLDMFRDNDECFVKSCRIRFRVRGLTCSAATALTDASYNQFVAGICLNPIALHCRVVFTILQDMRPSLVSPDSTSVPNPLPITVGMRPLESIYEKAHDYTQTNDMTMITCDNVSNDTNWGAANALLSYDSTRFKKIHQSVIQLTQNNPQALVDHTLVLNKRLKYMPSAQQEEAGADYPLNTNYFLFLSSTTGVDPHCNLEVPADILALCRPPSLDKLSIRTYFTS